MIIQIDFEAKSDSGNLKGRFKLKCDSREDAKEWLMAEIEHYKMDLIVGARFEIIPDDYLDWADLDGVISV